MRSNRSHNSRQVQTVQAKQDRPQRGPFKGLRTKIAKTPKDTNAGPSQRPRDDLEATHSPRRHHQDDFLPNPKIIESPGRGTPPKKIWEGAYSNYRSLGKSYSPHGSELSESPDVKESSFSVMPGTRRLVTQAAQQGTYRGSVPGISTTLQPVKNASRIQSMTVLDDGLRKRTDSGDSETRIPGFFRGVFNRSTSDGSVAFSRRSRNYSNCSGSDDLDSAMRHGMNKHSPDYHYNPRKQTSHPGPPPLPAALPNVRTMSQEDIPSGLDALLAGASISPHYSMEAAGARKADSHGMVYSMSENLENTSSHPPYYLPKWESSGSINHYQAGLNLEDDSHGNSSTSSSQHNRSKALDQSSRGPGGGSLLAQQVAAHTESESRQEFRQHQPTHPQHVQFQARQPVMHHSATGKKKNGSIIDVSPPEVVGESGALLHDARFAINSSTTNMMYTDIPESPPTVDPEMKKLFTTFHNQARFARDATSPFLGEDSPSPIHHDSYVSYHMMMGGGGMSVPYQAFSVVDLPSMGHSSTSLPLETVDEHNISIRKDMRLLKPVEGTEKWEFGRRYLIAPAALAACPLTVINRLSGSLVQTAHEAAESPQAFGMTDLGECLMTYIGETHHLSLGQWASCRLVLRQNYLLEFDTSAPITGLPRGYIHLQHARASKHEDFQNALKLDFYASPCAKADRRVLMIRAETREQCGYWIRCLNRAANMGIEDLWDFDGTVEFGRGRYAGVHLASRKTESWSAQSTNDDETAYPLDKKANLDKYDCVLKIVDKAEFWRRVVKGKERADTLVRETSAQGALTAKFGKLGTFVQLRGFFETSENIVIELELSEGTDLFKHISTNSVLKEYEAALILRDMLTSIEAMNRVGLAHRDIKPANLLMCDRKKDGVSVKLGDFGMSTFVGVDGLIRGRCGTPGYVAPEILTGGSRASYSNKVDVFSAGVTLYVMLCGYEPFYGETEKELIEANKHAKIEFPDEDWDRISNDARDLVLKMTHPDASQRITANDALKHPWMTRLDGPSNDDPASSTLGSNAALAARDVPGGGACLIS